MNTYHNKLLATVILFSFVGGLVASQEQGKFFDKSTRNDIKNTSIVCGVIYAQLYSVVGYHVAAFGLINLVFGHSLKDVLSDSRGLHRDLMRLLNRRIFPGLGAAIVGSAVLCDKYL